jgi:hypothetical protein
MPKISVQGILVKARLSIEKFGESIKNAFNQEDESLKIVTVDLTDEQRANTVGESLEVNDLSLLVQSILENLSDNYLLVWLILPVFKVSAACVGYRYAVGRLYA